MKANELMIGDWVKLNGDPLPQQVQELLFDSVTIQCWPHRYEDIEPIPLTKEILEKNGFKFDEFPKYAVNEIKEKTKVFFTYHSGSGTVFVSINEPNFNLLSDMVIWVHELQHILRHARIEKEIEL